MLMVDPSGFPVCGALSYSARTLVTLGPWHATSLSGKPHRRINGLDVYKLGGSGAGPQAWAAPALDTVVVERGPLGVGVLDTLTTSPRAAVITGPPVRTPSDWRQQTLGHLSFATPPDWPTRRTTVEASCKSAVAIGGGAVINYGHHQTIEPQQAEVELDSDKTNDFSSCANPFEEVAPGNGVLVNAHPALSDNASFESDLSVHLDHATVYISNIDAYDILSLGVLVPGRRDLISVQIGLGGDGSVARTILYSIHGT